MQRPLTLAQVKKRIKGLGEEQAKVVVCTLVGHSRIEHSCFGQRTCARCGEITGDVLMGGARKDVVIIGHDCGVCCELQKPLTWRDTFMAPEPTPPKKEKS